MLRRDRSRSGRGERGNQVVEFALLAPVFLMVVMLALDGGRMMATYASLKNATREAALYLTRNPSASNSTLSAVAAQESNGWLQSSKMSMSTTDFTWNYGSGSTQSGKQVTINYQFDFVNPLLSGGTSVTLNASAGAAIP